MKGSAKGNEPATEAGAKPRVVIGHCAFATAILVTYRPSREPAKDWRHEWQPQLCEQIPLDTAWHQRFSGVADATRAEAKLHRHPT
jgi:hypothetical protein